jgi:hypothetical protein
VYSAPSTCQGVIFVAVVTLVHELVQIQDALMRSSATVVIVMSPGRRNRAAGLPDIFWPMADGLAGLTGTKQKPHAVKRGASVSGCSCDYLVIASANFSASKR